MDQRIQSYLEDAMKSASQHYEPESLIELWRSENGKILAMSVNLVMIRT